MCCVYLYTPGIVFKVIQFRNKRNWIKSLCSMHSWPTLFSLSQEWGVAHYTHMLKEISPGSTTSWLSARSQILSGLISLSLHLMSAQKTTEYEDCSTAQGPGQFHHIIKCWVGMYYICLWLLQPYFLMKNTWYSVLYYCYISAKSRETRVDKP